jgi:hypothetical protein
MAMCGWYRTIIQTNGGLDPELSKQAGQAGQVEQGEQGEQVGQVGQAEHVRSIVLRDHHR